MAKKEMRWFSDKGEPCRSEGDALLADAGDAIEQFLLDNWAGGSSSRDEALVFLTGNSDKLLPLLTRHYNAVIGRQREVIGGTP